MTTGHTTSDMAERIAQLRAEIGTEPLVSHAQDPVGAEIGGAVFERTRLQSSALDLLDRLIAAIIPSERPDTTRRAS